MNREEIENRIEVCEVKANGYREVGNSKLADKYENEKYKWEKLLSDLELLNERKITELLEYKKGYLMLEQENNELKQKINTYEDPEDLTLMFMYCNEKAKDKIKELHNKIDKAIEVLSKINFDDETEWIPPKQIEPVFIVLKDSDVDE